MEGEPDGEVYVVFENSGPAAYIRGGDDEMAEFFETETELEVEIWWWNYE